MGREGEGELYLGVGGRGGRGMGRDRRGSERDMGGGGGESTFYLQGMRFVKLTPTYISYWFLNSLFHIFHLSIYFQLKSVEGFL